MTAVWFGIVIVTVLLGAFALEVDETTALPTFVLVIGLWVAGFVYAFSEHNQANNRKVAAFVGGAIVFAIGAGFFVSSWTDGTATRDETESSRSFDALEQLRLRALADSFSVKLMEAREADGIYTTCPARFRQTEGQLTPCLEVNARIKNNSNRTLREFTLWVEITDTLGNRVDRGGARTDTRLAPGEEAEFSLTVGARPEFGENRELSLMVWRPEFVE